MNDTRRTTLILGGTGKTGRRVAERLSARGLPVRVASRSGTPPFEWSDRSTWAAVLRGVDAAYIAYAPDLAAPGASGDIAAFATQAVAAGVTKLVLLSGRGEPGALPSERAVRDSGAAFTILRAAWFCQNFSEGMLVDGVLAGELPFPGGAVAEPFVDADDIADVAVAALTDDAHAGRTYELTGPRLLTFAQAAGEIAEATGRDLRYVPISGQAYGEMMRPYLPGPQVDFFVQLFGDVLDGRNAHLAGGVEGALGRPPRDFRVYARDAVATGAWTR